MSRSCLLFPCQSMSGVPLRSTFWTLQRCCFFSCRLQNFELNNLYANHSNRSLQFDTKQHWLRNNPSSTLLGSSHGNSFNDQSQSLVGGNRNHIACQCSECTSQNHYAKDPGSTTGVIIDLLTCHTRLPITTLHRNSTAGWGADPSHANVAFIWFTVLWKWSIYLHRIIPPATSVTVRSLYLNGFVFVVKCVRVWAQERVTFDPSCLFISKWECGWDWGNWGIWLMAQSIHSLFHLASMMQVSPRLGLKKERSGAGSGAGLTCIAVPAAVWFAACLPNHVVWKRDKWKTSDVSRET